MTSPTPLPPEHICHVPADDNTVVIPADDNTVVVPADE